MPDTIDINITPVIETVALTIQPNLTTINVNTVTGGGGAVDSVNGETGIVVLNQDEILDGTTYKQYSLTEKNKLAGIAAGAEVNVNADWNAVSGDAQILNKPTIPTAVTQTSQLTNNGADGVNPFITALDIGQATSVVREVKNMTGATLTKGTVVFISGANGNKPIVEKALATTDALSSRTFGLLQSDISNNGLGNCVIIGDLSGLDTSTFAEGDQLYLSGVTAGTYTNTKILAPTHLVYVGKVTRSHPTQGQIEVGIQNGYELSEIHDVALSSEANNQALVYESSTDLWKNKTIDKTFVGLGNVDNTSDANKPVSTAQQTAIDAKVTDSITDGVTTIAPSQNAVFDALALKQAALGFTPFKFVNTTSVTHTGTTALTILATATIAGDTFNSNDVMKILYRISKPSGTTGADFILIHINTSNTLSGAVQIARLDTTTNGTYFKMKRDFNLRSGNLVGFNFNSSIANDDTSSNTVSTSTTYNTANTLYVFFTIQLGNIANSVTLQLSNITN